MGYSLLQISETLLKADRTMYKLGAIAYENMFSEDSEDVDFERDIIYVYKKAVEYADDLYLGTTKLDQVVERLANKLVIYDYGQLNPIYSDSTIVTQVVPLGAALDDLSDVTITNVQNNQTLRYSSSLGQWVNVGPGASVRNRQQFTATLNQTVFVTSFQFESGLLDVYLNGVKLSPPSYTTFGNYTITLADGSLADDIVEVIAYAPETSFIDLSGYVPTSRTLTINGVTYDLSANRSWTVTAGLSSVGLSMPSAFTVSNSPLTANGTISVIGAGTTAQYIRGDGSLATFPALIGYIPYTGAIADVDLGEFGIRAGQFTLDTSPTGTAVVGTTRWNDTIGSSETTLKGGSVILKNGVDLVARVVNKVFPNATLTKAAYQAVRVSGAQGQRLAVAYAQANNDANSADTIGLVCETIATNQEGFIMTVGQLEGINTTGSLQGETWVDGDVLYLSPTTAGAITKVKPTGNGHIVIIGYVEYAHVNNGKIYVKVMNGWELDELHDVSIVSAANNEALIYESSTALWKNKTIAAALGFTPVTNARLINTTSPLVGGGDLSADRTLSIPAATSSVNGYLTSTDWTTFNNKQNTLTNPVTGTGTTNFLPKWTSGSAIGNSQVFDNGTSVGINNASPSSSWVLDINANNSTYNTRLYQPSTSTSAYNSLVISGAMTSAMGYFGIGGSATGNTAFRDAVVIGSQTANPLVFNTSDTERARLTAAGRLLLGTTTESTYLLDVNGTARMSGATYLATSSGSVGIGTTSPSYKLDVQGTSGTVAIRALSNTAGDILFYATGTITGSTDAFRSAINATGNVNAILANNNTATGGSNLDISVPSASTGDPYLSFTTSGATNWSIGIDNSDGDKFKIGPVSNPSNSSTAIVAHTTGNISLNTAVDSGYKLDVNGTARVSGASTFGGYTTITNTGGGAFTSQLTLTNSTSSPSLIAFTNTANGFAFGFNSTTTQRFVFLNGSIAEIASISGTGSMTANSGYIAGTAATTSDVSVLFKTDTGDFSLINQRATHSFGIYDNLNSRYNLNFTAAGAATFSSSVTATSFIPSGSSIPTNGMYLPSANTLGFATNSAIRATLDSSGNLGLGVTPSAWGGSYKAIQISSFASIAQGGNDTYIGNNWYNDGSNKYLITSAASISGQSSGSHIWLTAPSGTAGTVMTLTTRMTLTNGGNLLVGTTVDSGDKLQVNGTTKFNLDVAISGSTGLLYSSGQFGFTNTATAGQFGIYTLGTGTPTMYFDHRATSNVGRWEWRSGTGGATTAMTLSNIGAATFSSSVTATSFIKSGGTSSQYLMADGSVTTGGGGSVDELQVALISQVFG